MQVKALLVGIDDYPERPLRGCVNDVKAMRAMLEDVYAVPAGNICTLLDAAASRQGIIDGLRWLGARDTEVEAARLFFYAGHGTQQADETGEEEDGATECLVPHDYLTGDLLTDDTLRQLYARVAETAHVLVIMDCCHSGTIHLGDDEPQERFLALSEQEQERIRRAREQWQARREQPILDILRATNWNALGGDDLPEMAHRIAAASDGALEDASPENVVLIAACRDDQAAKEIACDDQKYYGLLTHFLIRTLRTRGEEVTYGQVIADLRATMARNQHTQTPQLMCAAECEVCTFLAGMR